MNEHNPPPIRRLAVIGDLHAEHARLAGVVEWFAGQAVDAVVCTGDVADGRGSLNDSCRTLMNGNVTTVAGNHDRWLLSDTVRHVPQAHLRSDLSDESIDFLEQLPRARSLNTVSGPLLLCHGIGRNDMARVWPGRRPEEIRRSRDLDRLIAEDGYRFVINGHMHFRVLMHFRNLTLMNAGTLMGERAGVTVIDFEAAAVAVFTVADDCRPKRMLETALTADENRRVWRDTREFDGTWKPVLLYA